VTLGKALKSVFGRDSAPDPGGELMRLPSRLEREKPLPHSLSPRRFQRWALLASRTSTPSASQQGCKQDVKSQDRDETETFHFFKLSRPRRDRDVEPSRPRRDETFQKNVSRPPRDRDARPRRSKKTYQDRSVTV